MARSLFRMPGSAFPGIFVSLPFRFHTRDHAKSRDGCDKISASENNYRFYGTVAPLRHGAVKTILRDICIPVSKT
jgi:hypothetical protein